MPFLNSNSDVMSCYEITNNSYFLNINNVNSLNNLSIDSCFSTCYNLVATNNWIIPKYAVLMATYCYCLNTIPVGANMIDVSNCNQEWPD